MRVLFWVQHLLGTGHLRRAMTLAGAMAEHGLEVVVASGGPADPRPVPPGVALVQLPMVRSRDLAFSALIDDAGRPIGNALHATRRARLLDLFDRLRPQVLVTEMFPFGRRAFRAELMPLLAAAAAARPRVWCLCSVRDILVAKPGRTRHDWMRDVALAHYDRVLVHTDPRLVPFGLSFAHAAALAPILIETGYVVDPAVAVVGVAPSGADVPGVGDEDAGAGSGEVLVSAGGGRVGGRLLETALAARALGRAAHRPWRLIAGAGLDPAVFGALLAGRPPGVQVERQREDFPALLGKSLLSVSQAGYNTVVEVLRLGKPMVLVPFETATETEQRLRAERLVSLGLAHCVLESELSPCSLARAIDAALDRPPIERPALALDGASVTARLVAELAGRPAPAACPPAARAAGATLP